MQEIQQAPRQCENTRNAKVILKVWWKLNNRIPPRKPSNRIHTLTLNVTEWEARFNDGCLIFLEDARSIEPESPGV